MRLAAMEQAMAIHETLEQGGVTRPILEDSLLQLIELRVGNNEDALREEVSDFVARAASCLHLNGGTQPVTVLERQINIPRMPRRVLLLGLPNDHAPFANRLKQAFHDAHDAGKDIMHDTYSHDDPTQLRLLLVDYWLAARLTTVAQELGAKYKGIEGNKTGDTAYFCNLDPAGEAGKRPSLFLPSPKEMRERYEAELAGPAAGDRRAAGRSKRRDPALPDERWDPQRHPAG